MATPARGWYDDGHGAVRWWDGTQWTEHVAPTAPGQPAPSGSSTPPTADGGDGVVTSQVSAGPNGPTAGADGFAPPAATSWSAPSTAGTPSAYGYSAAGPYSDAGSSPAPVATYPGAAAPPEAVGGSAAPQKSRGWLLWLIVGVGLVGVIAAVIVLAVTLITGGFGGPAAGPSADPAPRPQPEVSTGGEPEVVETEDGAPTAPADGGPTAPADAAAAATAAVETYNQAWLDSNCDAYLASTTEAFRALMELPDCESFYPESRNFAAQVSDFQLTVREVEPIGDAIAVSTTESFISPYDDEGNPTAEPQQYEDRWEYFVVYDGDAWRLDDLYPD